MSEEIWDLDQLLAIDAVVFTSSANAVAQQAAIGTTAPLKFKEIGTGQVGKVFEHPGTAWVYKIPLDSSPPGKIWNNYLMNRRVEESFAKLGSKAGQVLVPQTFWYAMPSTDKFWASNINNFEWTTQFPKRQRDVFCLERIAPLPRLVRECLIDNYCQGNQKTKNDAKKSMSNKDCLIRPLLGATSRDTPVNRSTDIRSFSLRNLRMHSDQIERIGLESENLAFAMADAFAVMHWHTKIDARDIEFVLGSSPVGARKTFPVVDPNVPTSTFEHATMTMDFTHRVTSLWVLDFDACSDITMDEAGVDKAMDAFVLNEAYTPRPHTNCEQHWPAFKKRYLATSKAVNLNASSDGLPLWFVLKVEDWFDNI